MSLAPTVKPSGRFFSAAAIASRPPSSRAVPASCTLSSEIVSLPSFSLPIWSSSSSAAASKRGGAPRASPIWSATSTLPRLAFAASTSLPLTEGSGALPDSVTRTTSRSADQTKGLASGTRRVSSLTRRTPGTASTAASAARLPSMENASAATLTSRPATETRFLSSTASLTAALDRAAISASSGSVLVQAAKPQRISSAIAPSHHWLLHLNSSRIRIPAVWENREKSNPWQAVKPEIAGTDERKKARPDKGFFSHRSLRSSRLEPGQPPLDEAAPQHRHPRRPGSAVFLRRASSAAAAVRWCRRHLHAASRPPAERSRIPAQPSSRDRAVVPARGVVAPARVQYRHRYHGRGVPAAVCEGFRAPLRLLHARRRLSRQSRPRAAGVSRIRRPLHGLCGERFRRGHGTVVVGRAGARRRQRGPHRGRDRRPDDAHGSRHGGAETGCLPPAA